MLVTFTSPVPSDGFCNRGLVKTQPSLFPLSVYWVPLTVCIDWDGAAAGEYFAEDAEDHWRVPEDGQSDERRPASGRGGGVSCRFSLNLWCAPMVPPLSFAFRKSVARSGLLDVPGDRYMERRLV